MTLRERIENTTGLDTYRALVDVFMLGLVPDPTEYADKLEADPGKFTKMGRVLGPYSGEKNSMHRGYKMIEQDLKSGLRKTGLDTHWEGDASETFTDVYIDELKGHLLKLADLCDKQKEIAIEIADLIKGAQEDLVDDVYWMVFEANVTATVGSVGTLFTGVFGTPLAGGAVAAGAIEETIRRVVEDHGKIQRQIKALDMTLGGKLLERLRALEQEPYETGLPDSVAKGGWRPPVGS